MKVFLFERMFVDRSQLVIEHDALLWLQDNTIAVNQCKVYVVRNVRTSSEIRCAA